MFLEYSRYNVKSPLEVSFPQSICEAPSKMKTIIAGRVSDRNFEAIALDSMQNEVFHILIVTSPEMENHFPIFKISPFLEKY